VIVKLPFTEKSLYKMHVLDHFIAVLYSKCRKGAVSSDKICK